MNSILRFLKNYKMECVLAPLFKLLEASFELLVPLVMARIIDNGIVQKDSSQIWLMGGALFLLALIGLCFSLTAQYFAAKAATGFAKDLKNNLFSHIVNLSMMDYDRLSTSTLITRMTSDVNQVQSGVNLVLRLFLRSPFIVLGAMFMAFTIDAKASIIFAVAIALLAIIVFAIMSISMPLFKKVQSATDSITKRTRENLMGARVIRAFNVEKEQNDYFVEENEKLNRLQLLTGRLAAFTNPLTFVVVNVALVILIYLGADRVYEGILTTGEVVALVNYMSQILVELIKLANLIVSVNKALACKKRIEGIFEIDMENKSDNEAYYENSTKASNEKTPEKIIEQEKMSEKSDYDTAVEFDRVSFSYTKESDLVLEDISFSIKKGETVGVIGGTASGKTTLIKLMTGLFPANDGSISIFERPVKEYNMSFLKNRVALVLQKPVLFSGTIKSNLLMAKKDASDDQLQCALNKALASGFAKLDDAVEELGVNFSGGQRQRLSIARALIKKPELLILDDATSALDYETDSKVRKNIAMLDNKPTTVIISQRASSLKDADKIIVLDGGRIVGIGKHSELIKNCDVYKEIYKYNQAVTETLASGKA